MKSVLKKYKFEILSFMIPFIALLGCFIYYTYFMHMHLSGFGTDYSKQHVPLYEMVRYSFYQTHNLFPQLNMASGGFSSYANMVYYGSMNPFVWISFLFPGITIQTYLELLLIPFIATISLLNFKVLKFHKIDDNTNMLTSIFFAVSPVIICHLQFQLPFIWFYPFFLLCIYAIQKFDERYLIFIACFPLVFYFNFQFSFATCIFLFLYMIYLYREKILCNKPFKYYFYLFVGCNIITLMIGFLPFIVQALASNSRTLSGTSGLFNPDFMADLFINNYHNFNYEWPLYLITVIAFLSLLFYKKSNVYAFMVFLFIGTLIIPINTVLNMFLYFDTKVFIYFIPFVMIAFIITMQNIKNLQSKNKFLIILLANVFIICFCYKFQRQDFWHLTTVTLILQNTLILCILIVKDFRLNAVISFVIVVVSFFSYSMITEQSFHVPIDCNKPYVLERSVGFDDINTRMCKEDFLMTEYTSIFNENLTKFKSELQYDYENFSFALGHKTLGEEITQDVLSIRNNAEQEIDPFIFGVKDQDLYANDLKTFSTIDMLTHIETNQKQVVYKDNPNSTYEYPGEIVLTPGIESKYDISSMCTSLMKVTFTSSNDQDVFINDFRATMLNSSPVDGNGRSNTYVLPCDKYSKITISPKVDTVLSDIKFEFYDYDNLKKNQFEKSLPTNVIINYNESISFDIDMETNGMIATTIPYDPGYIIKIDGVKVPIEKVNHYFLGANIEAGSHHVEISFKMRGFTAGMMITVTGICLAIILALHKYGVIKVKSKN